MRQQAVRTSHAWLAGCAGATAVLFGAFGAHALRGVLNAQASELWQTAVSYHMWHALALAIALGVGQGRFARRAAFAFALGIVLFSGSLYALALGAPRWTGIITPFGGVSFIAGWIMLGLSLRHAPRQN